MLSPTKTLLLALVTLGAGAPGFAGGNNATETTDSLGQVTVGQPMPTFAGYDLQGEMVRWRNFVSADAAPSRAILVSVFASWCEPCRDGLVVMEEIASGDTNLELLLINFQETEAEAAQFLRRLNITEATVIVDQYGSVSSRLGVDVNLPRTFLVDGAGRAHTIFTLEGRDFDEVLLAKLQEMRTANGFTRARERAPEILDHMDNVIDAEQ